MDGAAATSEMLGRIAAIGARLTDSTGPELQREFDQLRALAARHDLRSAAGVAHILGRAAATREHRAMVGAWLPVLADAVAGGRHDDHSASAYAAACSVRLAG